jgi:RimJ/RimL family protein N-acetyltransferase
MPVHIKLQPFTEADIDQLMAWVSSEKFLLQWAGPGFSFPLDRGELERNLVKAPQESPTYLIYKAVDSATGKTVGHGELLGIDRQNRSATAGRILVGPIQLRGQGVGAQIVSALLQIAFQELSLHRVVLRVLDFNKAGIRCYEKVGFRGEGLLRDVYKVGDQYWSLRQMSILEDEWRKGAP